MFDWVLNMLLKHLLTKNLIAKKTVLLPLPEKCPYSEFFWSVFDRIRTDYGQILRISPYEVRMRENKD